MTNFGEKFCSALGLQPDEVTEAEVHKRLLKAVDRPARAKDGRWRVLRRRAGKTPLDDKFWIEEITPE